MIRNKILETSVANNEKFKYYFWGKSRFHWKRSPSNKVVTIEEQLDGIDVDGIGNLMIYIPKLMFIDGKCGNLKVVVDGKSNSLLWIITEIITKRGSHKF